MQLIKCKLKEKHKIQIIKNYSNFERNIVGGEILPEVKEICIWLKMKSVKN